MSRIFVSFLGNGKYGSVRYKSWRSGEEGRAIAPASTFVQTAILQLYPKSDIDRILILRTEESKQAHCGDLNDALHAMQIEEGKNLEYVDIDSDLNDVNSAWKWFEKLQKSFNPRDHLVLDVTHGFRIVPIVFSAAIGYLKRVKKVQVDAVLYGTFDEKKYEENPSREFDIVDVSGFYSISDWTEGVGRLVDSADSSFLRTVASQEKTGSFAKLNNPELLNSIDKLTYAFRDAELQNVAERATETLKLIQQYQESLGNATDAPHGLERQVLQLAIDKFSPLTKLHLDGTYSLNYLNMQIQLTQMLADHGLYMQSFTAMREWFGSLGIFLLGRKNKKSKKICNDEENRPYAEIALELIEFGEKASSLRKKDDGKYASNKGPKAEELLPIVNSLIDNKEIGASLRKAIGNLKRIRNGFDHGWTGEHINSAPSIKSSEGSQSFLESESQKGIALMKKLIEVIQDPMFL